MKLDDETTILLDDIMTYFIGRNLGEELPVFNKEDARMIKKMEPFCRRVIDWNRDAEYKENPASNKKYGLVANMLRDGNNTD